MKHKLYNRLLSLALAVGLVIGMLPCAAAVDTVGDAGQPVTLGNGGEVSFTLPVKLYGDDGTDLSSQKSINIVIEDGQTVQLPGEYTQGIETISSGNKTYKFSYVADSMNGSAVSELKAGMLTETKTSTEGGGWRDDWKEVTTTTTNTYIVWYGNKPTSTTASNIIASRSSSNSTTQRYERKWDWDWGWSDWYKVGNPTTTETPLSTQSNKKTIHFMYDKDGTLVPDKELTRDKIVTLNGDGTYDLTLTVSGAAGSITNPQKMDVLFIFDRSNSMNNNSRLVNVKKAAKSLVTTLEDNEAIDARYSIVTFSSKNNSFDGNGTENDSWYHLGWTECKQTGTSWNPSNNIADSIDKISPSGGTNYQAGIRKGITQLNSCRSGAQKVVIFLTDGLPTYRIGGGNGSSDSGSYNINAAVEEIKEMNADAFYAIGVGNDFTKPSSTPVQNLNQLCNNVKAKQTGLFTVGDNGSSSDLEKVFKDIAGDAVSILCSDVTVTDTLSENVEIVTGGSGTPTSDDFTITVENENGQTVKTGQGSVTVDGVTITARYNEATRQIVLDFPDDYQLKKGYTYKVTTKIQATEAAYEAYRNNGNSYPDTGDQGTGTHAGQAGLHTNNKATVDYTYNGKDYSAEYPMPVIQLDPGTLTITKQITGDLENADITALKNNLTFTVNLNGEESSYKLNEFTPGADNTYSLTIKGLSPVTDYTVTENNATVTGYTLQTTKENDTGTVTKGGSATAKFVNDYQNTKNEYPVRFYLEGVGSDAPNYPFIDDWAKLDAVFSGGYVAIPSANTCVYDDDLVIPNGTHQASDTITGNNAVAQWLTDNQATPNLTVSDIKTALESLVALGNLSENTVLETVGNTQYTVEDILASPEDFELRYTQVAENTDVIQEYYKGNRNGMYQQSYHVHLTVVRKPGDLTITKTFEGIDTPPTGFNIQVKDGNTVIETLTLGNADSNQNGTYTWIITDIPEATYTIIENGTDVTDMVLHATFDGATTSTGTTATIVVTGGVDKTVAITNSYSAADGKLNINKVVTEFANNGKPVFDFKLTAQDGTVYYYHVDMTGTAVNTEKAATPDGGVTLPVGDYTIEELSNQNYTLESVAGATANNDGTYKVTITPQGTTTVTFTNNPKDTNIPTDGSATENKVLDIKDGVIAWKPTPVEYGKDHNENIHPDDEPAE